METLRSYDTCVIWAEAIHSRDLFSYTWHGVILGKLEKVGGVFTRPSIIRSTRRTCQSNSQPYDGNRIFGGMKILNKTKSSITKLHTGTYFTDMVT